MNHKIFRLWDWWKEPGPKTPEQLSLALRSFMDLCSKREIKIISIPEEYEIGPAIDLQFLENYHNVILLHGQYNWEGWVNLINSGQHIKRQLPPPNVIIKSWPNFFLYFTMLSYSDPQTVRGQLLERGGWYSRTPTKLFNNLNNRTRDHRLLMLDQLAKHDLINDNVISNVEANQDFIPSYSIRHFRNQQMLLDSPQATLDQFEFPVELSDTLIDLISESSEHAFFVTEKTYKAIIWERPFIIHGCPGIHAYLESLGYRLPRHVINYDFDLITDPIKRAEAIAVELKRLSGIPIQDLYDEVHKYTRQNLLTALRIVKCKIDMPDYIMHHEYYGMMYENVAALARRVKIRVDQTR